MSHVYGKSVLLPVHFDFRFAGQIPVTFMTGFYVANVVSRYWDQFVSLPWPDRVAYKVVTFIPGKVIVNGCCFLMVKIPWLNMSRRKRRLLSA